MSNKRKIGASNSYSFRPGVFGLSQKAGSVKATVSSNITRQRWMESSEVRDALEYLRSLESKSTGAGMFWRHKVDGEGRLQHLFWCDRGCRSDYKLFGDVVALDTTYGNSKYSYPLVVFSGVNNHVHTTIFASAIIADETKETYVWLFERLKEAMEAKSPGLVITNDDIALENAISRVFPNAHHRLCAQQVLCNVSSKVRNPMLTAQFKKLMLSDCVASKFDLEWHQMVAQFGIEDHSWVRDMYEKRKMWATAYIRGSCFVGFKATSQCEGLYVKFGRLARSSDNLEDVLRQFHLGCLDELRYKERDAEFKSVFGRKPVLLTMVKSLERSASRVFTREVFKLFRHVLARVGTMKVAYYCKEVLSGTSDIYKVSKYGQPGRKWSVHYYPPHYTSPTYQFVCDCKKMETFGIPCEHIIHVMVYLGIAEMPTSLVLKRWTKFAQVVVKGTCDDDDISYLPEHFRDQIDKLKDDDDVNFSNEDWNINLTVSSDEYGACFLLEDDDEVSFSNNNDVILDESDANCDPSFKRRAQNNVDDKW